MIPRGQAGEIGEVLARARMVAGFTEVPRLDDSACRPPISSTTEPAAPQREEPPAGPAASAPSELVHPGLTDAAGLNRPPEISQDDEPKPNSPEDVGFTEEARQPHLTPERKACCSSCPADCFWAQVVDDRGERAKNPATGRFRSMLVDYDPVPDGNVVVFRRPGQGIVCRVLKKGDAPPPGARLRKSHFATCPNAKQHRRSR